MRVKAYFACLHRVTRRAIAIAPLTENDFFQVVRIAGLCRVPIAVGPDHPPGFPIVLGVDRDGPRPLTSSVGIADQLSRLRGLYMIQSPMRLPPRFYPNSGCTLGDGPYLRLTFEHKNLLAIHTANVTQKVRDYWVTVSPYDGGTNEVLGYAQLTCGYLRVGSVAPRRWALYVWVRGDFSPDRYPCILPDIHDFVSQGGVDANPPSRPIDTGMFKTFRLTRVLPVPISPLFAIAHVPK